MRGFLIGFLTVASLLMVGLMVTLLPDQVVRAAPIEYPVAQKVLSSTVVMAPSHKRASTDQADPGESVTYTITLSHTGQLNGETLVLSDTLPAGVSYIPGTFTASQGTPDASQAPLLRWQGQASTEPITLTYAVSVTGQVEGSLVNQAQVAIVGQEPLRLRTALFVPRSALSSTLNDLLLPGTQPGTLTHPIPVSTECQACHSEPIQKLWRGNMMSQAGRDPLLWAALVAANHDVPNVGEYCLRCHVPRGWFEDRSHPADGSALLPVDLSEGVNCGTCHRMVDPVGSPTPADEAAELDTSIRETLTMTLPADHVGSAMLIVDPEDNRRGPFTLERTIPHPRLTLRTDFLSQADDLAVTRSRLCGSCHNVENPLLSWDPEREQYWPNEMDAPAPAFGEADLFPIEATYDEWLNSTYARGGVHAPEMAGASPSGMVSACQDCHMTRATGTATIEAFNPLQLDCETTGCLGQHDMVGGNTWIPQILQMPDWRLSAENEAEQLNAIIPLARGMLQRAATLTASLTLSGNNKLATVRVTNETGHKLPTGYPEGRRIWLNLQAYNANGELIYESGAYDPETAILAEDPALKVYEAKQGITPELAELLDKPSGATFHFVLNNRVVKDNRIPPRGYTEEALNRAGLEPVGASYEVGQYWDETTYSLPPETDTVIVSLYYQIASKEYIDFLKVKGGLDGVALAELWATSKSPPELMAQLELAQ